MMRIYKKIRSNGNIRRYALNVTSALMYFRLGVIAVQASKLFYGVSVAIIALVLIVVFSGIAKFAFIDGVPLFSKESPILFPFLLALLLLIALALSVVNQIRIWAKEDKKSRNTEEEKEIMKDLKAALIYFIGTFIYIALMRTLHFVPGTIIYTFLIMFFLNGSQDKMQRVRSIIIPSLVTAPAVYFVFNKIFEVILP